MLGSIRIKIGKEIFKYLEYKAKSQLRQNNELWNDLQTYLEKTESTSCSYSDLAALYMHVRAQKSLQVLELGTGVSTLVIAHALKANGEGIVTSMEEGEKWYEMAKQLLPLHLQPFVEFNHSPAILKTRDFFQGAGYQDIPNRPYDFVFVDGPSYLSNPKEGRLAFNYDLIEILEQSDKPVTALIDSRQSTCYVYSQLLGDRVRYDYIRNLGIVLPSTKNDLLKGGQVVRRFMSGHALKRPGIWSVINGIY